MMLLPFCGSTVDMYPLLCSSHTKDGGLGARGGGGGGGWGRRRLMAKSGSVDKTEQTTGVNRETTFDSHHRDV